MQTRERAHCASSVFPFIKKKKEKKTELSGSLGNVPTMVQRLQPSVLRAHNSEDSGIFDLFIQNREGCCIDY